MRPATTLVAAAGALAISASVAFCELTRTWSTAGPDAFSAGKLQGVSVLSTGELQLAPETEKVDGLAGEFVWDVAMAQGGTVYVATGSPGGLYALEGGRLRQVFKADQKQVLSVLPLPDGTVLAATAPDGLILRVSRRGEVTTLADLEDSYVWDMALGPRNEIYLATGPAGRLLELDRAGKVTERLRVKQKNIMCVAVDPAGAVYFGTDTEGLIYRLGPEGKASVIFDADESEVHALAVDGQGHLFAATSQPTVGEQRAGPQQGGPAGAQAMAASAQAMAAAASGAAPGRPVSYNSIYRIVAGQGAVPIARFDRLSVFSLAALEGRVLAGTGPGGRVMAVHDSGLLQILAEFEAGQVTALSAGPDGEILVGLSNAAGLWRMKSGYASSGTFTSRPFDAGFLSQWGRLWCHQRADEGQSIRLRLRTGNSAEPDDYWSPWSDWLEGPAGGPVTLPMGRFAQFCAELRARPRSGTPTLLQVSASYRQVNVKPAIQNLAVDGAPVLEQTGQEGGPGGARRPGQPAAPSAAAMRERQPTLPPGVKEVIWQAADPNGDELVFDLYYRALDERDWKVIEKNITGEPRRQWDTSRLPDGYYLLRLVARDDVSRPAEEALADERISRPLLIDNGKPTVLQLAARRQRDGSYLISGVAQDSHSPITKIEVSVNGGDWVPVFPADGLLDSPEEPFSYKSAPLEAGEHVFVFAATDAAKNVGAQKIIITVQQER